MKKALMKLELHKSQTTNKSDLSVIFFSENTISYYQKIINIKMTRLSVI